MCKYMCNCFGGVATAVTRLNPPVGGLQLHTEGLIERKATAVVAGILSVVIALVIPGNSYIVLASILAATIGVVFRRTLLK